MVKPADKSWNILARRAAGRSPAQIAGDIGMSTKGVQYHLNKVQRYLGAENGYETIARAIAAGYIEVKHKEGDDCAD